MVKLHTANRKSIPTTSCAKTQQTAVIYPATLHRAGQQVTKVTNHGVSGKATTSTSASHNIEAADCRG